MEYSVINLKTKSCLLQVQTGSHSMCRFCSYSSINQQPITSPHTHQPSGVWGHVTIGPHRGMPVLQARLGHRFGNKWPHLWHCDGVVHPNKVVGWFPDRLSPLQRAVRICAWAKALFRGTILYCMCTFSTHYKVMADLSEMTEKLSKWTLSRPL